MSRIRGKDTIWEKVVRSLLHRMRYHFRLHGKKLPGRPDIVLPKYKNVVFAHGCFWPRHLTGHSCRVVDRVGRSQYSPPDGTPAHREVR
jgi:DNA mismatch endonuclease Vsr